ncbi:MAG: hypothetical protein K2H21_08855 [Muribaculaceae bacterium]|nr:hypothetical protein [Muribaculaceae bacterium]
MKSNVHMRTVKVSLLALLAAASAQAKTLVVYSMSGARLLSDVCSTEGLTAGIYIIDGKTTIITK